MENSVKEIGIGHNGAPEPTPFETVKAKIDDLYDEAKLWLDGAEITSQDQADEIQKLMRLIQASEKEADEARKEEAKPHDDAKAEIQERFNLLIGKTKSVTGKTVKAVEACKKALAPWLQKLETARLEREAAALKEAEEKNRLAMEAMRQRTGDNLEQNEQAEQLVKEAKAADSQARRIGNEKASAKGFGRAASLRTSYVSEVTNYTAFARFVWAHHKVDLCDFLDDLARQIVARGNHNIDGVTVKEERKVA
ncbi:hypothetical protein [Ochrobactrum sp. S1502_03]|uniref:hypothetical protein n=1 Tax=Ochrobactrum sp. S1502_03 TaxID=3108451 RepID=UPI0037C517C5